MLYYITLGETYLRFSDFHNHYLDRAFFYMILNMLVVPGLAVPAGQNLFDLFLTKIFTLDKFLLNFYNIQSADFFVILLIQQISFGYMANINQFALLYNYYFSPSYLLHMKQRVERQIPLLKNEFRIFNVGYSYALNLTCLSIVFIFSIHVPLVLLLGILYFFMRFVTDAHLMLNIHKEELDSSFKIVHNACIKVLNILMFFQICLLFKALSTNSYPFAALLGLVLIFTFIFSNFFLKKFLRPELFLDEEVNLDPRHLKSWKEHFTHPILKTRNNISLQRRHTVKQLERVDGRLMDVIEEESVDRGNVSIDPSIRVRNLDSVSGNPDFSNNDMIEMYSHSNQVLLGFGNNYYKSFYGLIKGMIIWLYSGLVVINFLDFGLVI